MATNQVSSASRIVPHGTTCLKKCFETSQNTSSITWHHLSGGLRTAWGKAPVAVIFMAYTTIVVWFVGGLMVFHTFLTATNQGSPSTLSSPPSPPPSPFPSIPSRQNTIGTTASTTAAAGAAAGAAVATAAGAAVATAAGSAAGGAAASGWMASSEPIRSDAIGRDEIGSSSSAFEAAYATLLAQYGLHGEGEEGVEIGERGEGGGGDGEGAKVEAGEGAVGGEGGKSGYDGRGGRVVLAPFRAPPLWLAPCVRDLVFVAHNWNVVHNHHKGAAGAGPSGEVRKAGIVEGNIPPRPLPEGYKLEEDGEVEVDEDDLTFDEYKEQEDLEKEEEKGKESEEDE
ncbi:unnamed protein product [Closterium sp. Naga37s-1]|nr:unnamed protein product [Closterium sp. Naga37s-1]